MSLAAQPEIRFRVEREDHAKAEEVAARIGMSLNEAMKVMFKRFIVEDGLPFDMRRPPQDDDHGAAERFTPVFGVSHELLAEVASKAAREAAAAHVGAGRLVASTELAGGERAGVR